jgi:hypothetical protein
MVELPKKTPGILKMTASIPDLVIGCMHKGRAPDMGKRRRGSATCALKGLGPVGPSATASWAHF